MTIDTYSRNRIGDPCPKCGTKLIQTYEPYMSRCPQCGFLWDSYIQKVIEEGWHQDNFGRTGESLRECPDCGETNMGYFIDGSSFWWCKNCHVGMPLLPKEGGKVTMEGKRRDLTETDSLPHPGEYGRMTLPNGAWYWYGCMPVEVDADGLPVVANLASHDVIEHEDGTITVSPSILVRKPHKNVEWHGFLERGIWREV